MDDPLEETTNLESTFYSEGYSSGFEHGRLHGLFEGRALGSEKSFEIWEEVGYYEGFALVWRNMLARTTAQTQVRQGKDKRILAQAEALLGLIGGFPTTNPTPSPSASSFLQVDASEAGVSASASVNATISLEISNGTEVDLPQLLSSIRAKYKLLCTSLGMRPRLYIAKDGGDYSASASQGGEGEGDAVEGIEGPMKGVDTRQLRY